jgi:hypothetical protein
VERCAMLVPPEQCKFMNDTALAGKAITEDAYAWLSRNKFCASSFGQSIFAICKEGCFEANTQLLTLGTNAQRLEKSARDITKEDRLAGLSATSGLTEPILESRTISSIVHGPESIEMFRFTLGNGRSLQVTQHHGMVLDDGRMLEAKDVDIGDHFVDVNGQSVEVKAITRASTTHDVYNFQVDVPSPQEHIVVAEGVLVGDLAWQNELASELTSIQLRR